MKEEIKIIYKHYVPTEIISDFAKLGFEYISQTEIEIEKQNPNIYNYAGYDIPEIIIYIKNNVTGLLTELIVTISYDTFKNALKLLWTEISKLDIKILKGNGKTFNKPKNITLRISNNDRAVEISLDGNVSEEQADKIIAQAFEFVNSEKLEQSFKNPEFILPNSKPRIRIKYNKEKQIWEPENFAEHQKFIGKIEKSAQDLSS